MQMLLAIVILNKTEGKESHNVTYKDRNVNFIWTLVAGIHKKKAYNSTLGQ